MENNKELPAGVVTTLYSGIISILDRIFLGRPFGFKVAVLDKDHFVTNFSQNEYWLGRQRAKGVEWINTKDLSNEKVVELYQYLEVNKFTLDEYKEPEMNMDKEWEIEPLEIKTEENETVGAVGVVFDEVLGANRVVFLSADATASTITIFGKGDEEEKQLAIEDLRKTSDVLLKLIDKLHAL